ncbi:MAG TPA: DnaJ domain-containing protein, partial [Bdellovibrionales bacterium]|nr:DnaJ domain-containing protein [Bdellovibrionales bacterium]
MFTNMLAAPVAQGQTPPQASRIEWGEDRTDDTVETQVEDLQRRRRQGQVEVGTIMVREADHSKAVDYNLYEVLGVRNDASPRDIRRAYDQLSKHYLEIYNRGGRHLNNPQVAEALDKYDRIQQAYEILSNSEKRMIFDIGYDVQKTLERGSPTELSVWDPSKDLVHPGIEDKSLLPSLEKDQMSRLARAGRRLKHEGKEIAQHIVSVGNVGFMIGMASQMYLKCLVTMDPSVCWTIQDAVEDVGGLIGLAGFAGGSAATNIMLTRYLGLKPDGRMAPMIRASGMIVGSRLNHYISKIWNAPERAEATMSFREWRNVVQQSDKISDEMAVLNSDRKKLFTKGARTDDERRQLARLDYEIAMKNRELQRLTQERFRFRDIFWKKADAAFWTFLKTSPEEALELNIGMVSMLL